jgi:hypothetical protein
MRVLGQRTQAVRRSRGRVRRASERAGGPNEVIALPPPDPGNVSMRIPGGAPNQMHVASQVSYLDWRISSWILGGVFAPFGLFGLCFFLFTAHGFSVLMMVLVVMGILAVAAGSLFH